MGINPATFVGTDQNLGFVAPIECPLPNSRHNPAWVTISHMKFFRFYATGTACLACGTGPFLPVPVWVARLVVPGDTGRAAPLPEPIIGECHKLSSLIRVTVTLQF